MTRTSVGLVVVTALTILQGGSCVVERPYPAPKTEEVVAAVRARALRVQSLRAETRLSHRSEQGRVKATVRLMGERSGKLRADVVSPFDTPLATLVSNGSQFALIDSQKNRYYHGPAQPCNIARLLQLWLQPDDVLTILGGSTPLIEHQRAELAWDSRAGAEILTLHGAGLVQTVRLDGQKRSWDLLLSEIKTTKGEVVLRIETGQFHTVAGLRVPRSLKVAQPMVKADLDVAFQSLELNLKLPAEAFELPEAGGLPSQRVDCTTEIKQ